MHLGVLLGKRMGSSYFTSEELSALSLVVKYTEATSQVAGLQIPAHLQILG